MTLRKKVLLIFTFAFLVFCTVYGIEFVLSNRLAETRIKKSILVGQTSTWRKVREATYERMLFYAYDAKPGKPSIWRLRGRRSPVEAVVSGNSKKVRRAILPMYKNLQKDKILDIIWVFGDKNTPLLVAQKEADGLSNQHMKSIKNMVSSSILDLISQTKKTKIAHKQFILENQQIYATISFPIFANARVAGTVIYGKKIDPLIEDLAKNTRSEAFVFHSRKGFIFGTDPLLRKLVENRSDAKEYSILESKDKVFLANSLRFDLKNDVAELVFLLNVTKEYKKQRVYYLITLTLIIVVAIILLTLTNFLLRRGFTPLDQAIDVLNALSAGDTSVDIEAQGDDEVGRIATTVSSFRKSLIEREKARSLFGKYIPQAIAEKLLKEDGGLEPQTAEATIFFVDLAGFTSMSEKMEPVGIVEILNEYFSAIVSIIERNNGVITQFQGDAVLAIFNVPIADPKHAVNAVKTAEQIRDLVSQKTFCGETLSCRIGITTGDVVAGNVGAKDRLNYTVHGDIVNLAARLEQMNKEYGTNILIAESTVSKIKNVKVKELGNIEIRGKDDKVSVFTLA